MGITVSDPPTGSAPPGSQAGAGAGTPILLGSLHSLPKCAAPHFGVRHHVELVAALRAGRRRPRAAHHAELPGTDSGTKACTHPYIHSFHHHQQQQQQSLKPDVTAHFEVALEWAWDRQRSSSPQTELS